MRVGCYVPTSTCRYSLLFLSPPFWTIYAFICVFDVRYRSVRKKSNKKGLCSAKIELTKSRLNSTKLDVSVLFVAFLILMHNYQSNIPYSRHPCASFRAQVSSGASFRANRSVRNIPRAQPSVRIFPCANFLVRIFPDPIKNTVSEISCAFRCHYAHDEF